MSEILRLGGIKTPNFYLELVACMICIIWSKGNYGFVLLLLFFVFFYSTRWLNEVIFNNNFFIVKIRQPFKSGSLQLKYERLEKVEYLNSAVNEITRLRITYSKNATSGTSQVIVPYNINNDPTKILDFLKQHGVHVEVKGYMEG